MPLQKLKNSILKSISSRNVLKKIKSTEQLNIDCINVHRIDEKNIGDFYCAPYHYFDKIGKNLDIFNLKSIDAEISNHFVSEISNNSLIIGGGGLLNRSSFEKQLKLFEALGDKNKKTVLWGVGHNEKDKRTFGKVNKYNIDTSKFGLVGVRDYNMKENWVPCASCLHPILDTPSSVKNEVGLIFHKKTVQNAKVINQFKGFPSTSNTTSLEDMVNFIAETEIVVTDSYHAMYWSILMEKKVMVIPNSSKFYSFKYDPVFTSFDNFTNDLKKAQKYTGVLAECREINLTFSEKVFDYLGY